MILKFFNFFKSKAGKITGIVVILVLIAGFYFVSVRPDGKLHLYFLDIGQGDSALIQTPSGKLILVDGGAGTVVLRRLNEVLPYFKRDIDLVIATHTDKDHSEGLISVVDRYHVKEFLMPGSFQNSGHVIALFEKLLEKNIPTLLARADEDFVFDGVKLDILFPFRPLIGETDETNSTSIVFKLVAPDVTALYTGDADEPVEQQLLRKKIDVHADILKVGHHGSKYSSTMQFLEKVQPQKAVISSGKNNSYKHPHQEVLERLQKIGAEVLRTDSSGTIELVF